MRAYGNLAVAPKTRPKTRRVTRKVIRKKGLPVQEKLIYLGTVILFVLLASFLLTRYVQLTEINYKIQQTEQKITENKAKNTDLEREARDLSDPKRIERIAKKKGMEYDPSRIKTREAAVSTAPSDS